MVICGGDALIISINNREYMKQLLCLLGLLAGISCPLCAQQWTSEDSIRLQRMLEGEGEIKLNPEVLKELEAPSWGTPKVSDDKSWLQFDNTLPQLSKKPQKKVKLTLYPYTSATPYNWDPILGVKIKIDENTWRGDPFYELKSLRIYTNWARSPLDAGPRESVEQIEATGLRYIPQVRLGSAPGTSSWQSVKGPSGYDLMTPFTKDFWNRKGRKRRRRTLEVLQSYGDSLTLHLKEKPKEH